MSTSVDICVVRVPTEVALRLRQLWKELRVIEGLGPEHDLDRGVETENFDATSMSEWIVPLSPMIVAIISGVFGYLAAARGELEIERKGTRVKMKNLRPSELSKVIDLLDEKDGDA